MTDNPLRHARLRDEYDCLLVDLDGTLFRGAQPIEGAVEALAAGSQTLLYVTNNSSRSADEVVKHLESLGFSASPDQVVTSGQATASYLAAQLPAAAEVLVVGTDSLAREIANVGLSPVRKQTSTTAAVVQGLSHELNWTMLAEAAYAIAAGALWVTANQDATLPTERGLAPGNGSMVAALRHATGAAPISIGKPEKHLNDEAVRRVQSRRPLVVGDRLDTDIAGALASGIDSLLVLTGVSTVAELAEPGAPRPTYVAQTLDSLNRPSAASRFDGIVG